MFCRDEVLGLRLTLGGDDCNLLRKIGVSVSNFSNGTRNIVMQHEGRTTVQADSRVIDLLMWINPLATKIGTRIGQLKNGQIGSKSDTSFGQVVQLEIVGEKRIQVLLAKDFGWRPVRIKQFAGSNLVYESEYHYDREGPLGFELRYLKRKGIHPNVLYETELTLGKIQYSVTEEELTIPIPSGQPIFDLAEEGIEARQYIVRKDGSRRYFSDHEMRIVKGDLQKIANTNEGDLLKKNDSGYFGGLFVVLGISCVAIGLFIVVKRSLVSG